MGEILDILDEVARYVLNHGKFVREETPVAGKYELEMYVVKECKEKGFTVQIEEWDIMHGKENADYIEGENIDERTIKLYLDGKMVFEANRCVRGEGGTYHKGNSKSEKHIIKPTNWQVRKSDSLDKVTEELSKFRAKHNTVQSDSHHFEQLEKVLEYSDDTMFIIGSRNCGRCPSVLKYLTFDEHNHPYIYLELMDTGPMFKQGLDRFTEEHIKGYYVGLPIIIHQGKVFRGTEARRQVMNFVEDHYHKP